MKARWFLVTLVSSAATIALALSAEHGRVHYRVVPYSEALGYQKLVAMSASGPASKHYSEKWGVPEQEALSCMQIVERQPLLQKRFTFLPGPEYAVADRACFPCEQGNHDVCYDYVFYCSYETQESVARGDCTCCGENRAP